MSLSAVALSFLASGFSVIPINGHDKRPAIGSWSPYQVKLMDSATAETVFKEGRQIAVITGAISGNLELLDFDTDDSGGCPHFGQWWAMLKENGYEELLKSLAVAETPSGGRHVFFKCPEGVESNQPLAKQAADKPPVIETRGEGGYALMFPSPGYVWKQGNLGSVPSISLVDRETLMYASKMFDSVPEKPAPPPRKAPRLDGVTYTGEEEPWIIYNRKTDMRDLIGKDGWVYVGMAGSRERWRRPGKDRGEHSATITTIGDQVLYPFTTSTIFPSRQGLDCFGVYTWLNHGGDFSAATKAIRTELGMAPRKPVERPVYGFGSKEPIPVVSGQFKGKKLSEFDQNEFPEFGIFGQYLACGHYCLLDGSGGLGKSTFIMAIAAFGSRGYNKVTDERFTPWRTKYFSTEDDGAGLLRKFLRFGGDPDMIELISEPFSIYGEGILEELEQQIVADNIKFWVFDPGISYMPGMMNTNGQKDVNDFTMGLKQIARRTNSCCLIVRHFALRASLSEIENKGSGSAGWRDYCRSQLVLLRHPENRDQRIIVHGKPHPEVKEQPSFGFEWTPTGFNWIMPGCVEGELGERGKP